MQALQRNHLDCVARMFETADVFVFTMGLTEAWISNADGAVFPLCPGTVAGTYDDRSYRFHNLSSAEVRADMERFLSELRAINPKVEVLLTVSPVPLMATATPQQVFVASSYSKSVLRAVAGELYDAYDFVEYFPSYEIITAPFMQGFFFEPDRREVSPHGVAHVMKSFFAAHKPTQASPVDIVASNTPPPALSEAERKERVKCDEELLAEFGEGAE